MSLDHSDTERLTRRTFIGLITSFSVFSSLLPFNPLSSLFASEKRESLKSKKLLQGSLKFFTPHQARVVEEVTSLIVPSDDGPGAREAGAVFEIDKAVAENQRLKGSYIKGIEALDQIANQLGGKDSFLDLNQDEMMEILKMAYASKSISGRGAISDLSGSMLPGLLLINHLIRQTIAIFYTSELGWKVVGYKGPPQLKGNPRYHKCSI